MKLKSFAPLLAAGAFFMLMSNRLDVSASSGYAGGSGTQNNPYLISTPEHLNQLQVDVNGGVVTTNKYYKLMNDIDLSTYDNDSDKSNGNFTPIGNSSYQFKGTFDGNGKVISNLKIILPEQDYVGLFGRTTQAIVQKLGLENVLIEGKEAVGSLIGYLSNGRLSQSYATGSVSASGKYSGGLVGYQDGYQAIIEQSYSKVNVSGTSRVGGLAGYQSSSAAIVRESYAVGKVIGTENVGGLIGYTFSSATAKNSYWDVQTTGVSSGTYGTGLNTLQMTGENVKTNMTGFDFDTVWRTTDVYPEFQWQPVVIKYGGGLGTESEPYLISTPEHLNQLQLDVNVSKIDTTGKYYRLTQNIDFSGYDNDSDESNGNFTPIGYRNSSSDYSYFKGIFNGNGKMISNLTIILPEQNYVGLFGYVNNATIQYLGLENVWIQARQDVGGITGGQDGGVIDQSYVTGEVKATYNYSYVGGLVGSQKNGTISESYSTSDVNGGSYVGGLVGYQNCSSCVINKSYATGNVSGSSGNVGGLIGSQSDGTVSESYATGNVSGSSYSVGGLVGHLYRGIISKSYATGNVSGSSKGYIGGLVGKQEGSNTTHAVISESYATGNVSGSSSDIGGVVGYQKSSTTVESSYWDVETTGQSSSQGGTGLTTEQMKKRKPQKNMIGFDFESTWQLSNGYPLLHWQTPEPINDDIIIVGSIEATVLSFTIPTEMLDFVLDPNQEEGRQFIASDFELINKSKAPLSVELKTFEQVTNDLTDVEPTKYTDWRNLTTEQSKDFALALVPKMSDGWLSLNEGERWVANLGETQIGTVKGSSTVSFGFEAKHGSSFTETLTPQYRLTFVFGLQD